MRALITSLLLLLLTACSGLPQGASAVTPFDQQRYLGTWHEHARLPHRFEQDLEQVTAHYELDDDGSIRVTNRGFNLITKEWEQAEGRALRVDEQAAMLKVSFFGPFYSAYNVLWLSDDYQVALVSSYNTDYLWLLSRSPAPNPHRFVEPLMLAESLGFDLDRLEWPATLAAD